MKNSTSQLYIIKDTSNITIPLTILIIK